MEKNLWHLYIRLVSLIAMIKEIDTDVWHSDDALDQLGAYLEEIFDEVDTAKDYVVQLRQEKRKNDTIKAVKRGKA